MKNAEQILNQFLDFLKKEGCSQVTCKNYAADIRHFLKFLDTKRISKLSPEVFLEYKKFLTTTPLSLKSINRKLSTLRKFGHHLTLSGAFSKNPAAKIKNISPLTKKVAEIKAKKIIRPAFLAGLATAFSATLFLIALTHPSPPSPPKLKPVLKTLSFQGQLTDDKGHPKTLPALATFRLWDQKRGGNQLYSSGFCFVKPDQNGLFSIVIGQDCGKKIPAHLFTKYEKIYLEMEVEGEKKFARTQILNTRPTFFTFQERRPVPTPKRELEDSQILKKTLQLLTTLKEEAPGKEKLFDSLEFKGGSKLFEKEGRLTTTGDFEVSGKIIDGGLGIFGTAGRKLPSTFDFTKGLTLEFDFQTGEESFEVVLSPEVEKSYYCSWDKTGQLSIGKIINGIKDQFLKVEKTWQDNTWFRGRIALQQSTLAFKVSGTTISAPLDSQSVPLTKTGTIKFSGDIKSIANLRIFTGERTILSSGEAEVEENLQIKGAFKANLSGEASTTEVCWQGNMDAAQLVTCSSGADLAEYYEPAEDVEEGDVVSINNQQSAVNSQQLSPDEENSLRIAHLAFSIVRSSRPYDPNLIGVVSTLPWRIMGKASETANPKPVALAGRVPVKVKGKIEVGDPLTSSETPGVAQKATQEGLILGRALEGCRPQQHTGSGRMPSPGVENGQQHTGSGRMPSPGVENGEDFDCKILAFINISWHKPKEAFELAATPPSEESPPAGGATSEVALESPTPGVASPLPEWQARENLTFPNDFTVLGKTSLGETSIAGDLMVDGSLSLSAGRVDNLFGPLKLQPLGQRGVDILNGKVLINPQGDLTLQGKLFAQEIETQKLDIKENAGTAVLPAGQTELRITNYLLTNNSLIFLTPLSPTGNRALYVKLKNPGEHFIVGIESPLRNDVVFNWLIVN